MIKKNIKLFIGIIIGVILGGTVVYAGTIIAIDVDYDNTHSQLKDSNNQDVDNVQDAIDVLYNKANRDIIYGNPLFNASFGDQLSSRTAELELNKGSYIVMAIAVLANHAVSVEEQVSVKDNAFSVLCSSNNCNVVKIDGNKTSGTASTAHNDSYVALSTRSYLYNVNINENTDTLRFTQNTFGDRTFNRADVHLLAVPISK